MNGALSAVLWPLIVLMEAVFEFYTARSGSYGLSLIALGATVAVAVYPLQRYGKKIEMRLSAKNLKIKEATRQLGDLSGEARFVKIEKIYRQHKFHPAHNMLAGASFIVQLPFLLAVFLIFSGGGLPAESSFLFLADLSRPDGALHLAGGRLNVLPVLMLALAFAQSQHYYAGDPTAKKKFMVISLLIFLLIYQLPSGLVLYWIALNIAATAVSLSVERLFK